MVLTRIILLINGSVVLGFSQQRPDRFVATLQGVCAGLAELQVRTGKREPRMLTVLPATIFQRVAPGEQSLKNAQSIRATDLDGQFGGKGTLRK